MKSVKFVSFAAVAFALATPAMAADMPAKAAPVAVSQPAWFVEGRVGGSFGWFNDLKFLNPDGTGATTNAVSGDYILLNSKDLSDASFTGGASVGYFFNNQWFAKLSYQYFGQFRASGFAAFPGAVPAGNYRQDLKTTAHGILVGVGANFNVTQSVFVEPSAEIGVGVLRSTGQQGANLGVTTNNFPSKTNTNFIAGGGLGVGYRVNPRFDVLLSSNYYWLGKADTGVTGSPPPGTMNVGEQLQANLSVVTVTIGGRAKF